MILTGDGGCTGFLYSPMSDELSGGRLWWEWRETETAWFDKLTMSGLRLVMGWAKENRGGCYNHPGTDS